VIIKFKSRCNKKNHILNIFILKMSTATAWQIPPVKYEMQSLIIQMIFRDFIIIYRFQHKWTQSGRFKTGRSNFTVTRIRKYFEIQFHAFYSSEYIFSMDFIMLNVVLHFHISFFLILCAKKLSLQSFVKNIIRVSFDIIFLKSTGKKHFLI